MNCLKKSSFQLNKHIDVAVEQINNINKYEENVGNEGVRANLLPKEEWS